MQGFRNPQQPTTKDKIAELREIIDSLQQVIQMNQAMISKQNTIIRAMQGDIAEIKDMQITQDYRTVAMIKLANNSEDVNRIADELKLNNYNQELEIQDAKDNLVPAEEVTLDSMLVLTSTTEDPIKNPPIFRSRILASKLTPFKDLAENIIGKRVGDKIETEIAGAKHSVEILSIKVKKSEVKE